MIPEPQVIQKLVDSASMMALKAFIEPFYEGPQDNEWGGLSVAKLRGKGVSPYIAPIERAVAERFPNARLMDDVSCFRRVTRETYIYWHMDADGTGSWRYDPLFNCWMPLERVGVGYPSLEVITNSEKLMRRVGPNSGPNPANRAHRSDEWVAENCPKPEILCPAMLPGDALIFSHFMLHRTQPLDVLAGPRIGCEMRFALDEKRKVA